MRPGIAIPPDVEYILNRIAGAGFEAFVVGGCVRDSLMGQSPSDWDIATNAKPEEIKGLFEKTVDTGIRHGTVTVLYNGKGYEITTYRVDGPYTDYRRPKEVYFSANLKEDLARRDFTVNAMAYNPSVGLVDYFDGIGDLRRRIIKAVGNPDKRFNEDALRMLRAVRFSAQLGFDLEADTLASIERNSSLIVNISMERIRDELTKTIVSKCPERFGLLQKTGLLRHVIPELSALMEDEDMSCHMLKTLTCIESDAVLRWTMLLHEIARPVEDAEGEKSRRRLQGLHADSTGTVRTILKRLKMDNRSSDNICRLIYYLGMTLDDDPRSVRKAVRKVGKELFEDLLKVLEADLLAQGSRFPGKGPENGNDGIEKLNRIREIYNDIIATGQCTSLKELAVNGTDLLELGISRGKETGLVLEKLLDAVLEDPELNSRDRLLELARRFAGDHCQHN